MKMSKKIVVISTSLRKGGNSETLADEFMKGAKEAGNEVDKVSLVGKNIGFCKGCLSCAKLSHCVIADDAVEIAEKMGEADIIAFATPIYYYEMCGQMKTMLDRANPLYGTDYRFREIYMLSTAAEEENTAADKAENGLQGWIDCFPKAYLAGTVFAGGVDGIGKIAGHQALQKAYEMGKAVGSEGIE